jgi:hypothetical protein
MGWKWEDFSPLDRERLKVKMHKVLSTNDLINISKYLNGLPAVDYPLCNDQRKKEVPFAGMSRAKVEDHQISSPLKEALVKGDCLGFKRIMRVIYEDTRHRALRKDEKDELRLMLPDFEKLDPRAPEIAIVLRYLDGFFSTRDKEDKLVLDSLIVKYLRSASISLRSFPLFLTSLKKLDYRWRSFGDDVKERILNIFDLISNDEMLTGREYSEIMGGITGLGMNWNDLKERTRETLLGRLKNIYWGCDMLNLYSIIFNMGKLSVHIQRDGVIWETVLQMASKILELIEKVSNLKDRERIVSFTCMLR